MKKSLIMILLLPLCTLAHEIRPAMLEITQTAHSTFLVSFKLPRTGSLVPAIQPLFPDWFTTTAIGHVRKTGSGAVFQWKANSDRDIRGMKVKIQGADAALIDVLVVINLLDGKTANLVIPSSKGSVTILDNQDTPGYSFLWLGIEHILEGYDHLAFVLALMLLAGGWKRILWTATAFTISHSITLSLSVLGFIGLPSPPVEITIAISIVFLAVELVHHLRGEQVLSARYPWAIAFLFGLLHGFGFAGALNEIGIPQGQAAPSLFKFNLGVEIGQIIFIAMVMMFSLLLERTFRSHSDRWKWIVAYGIGILATFWVLDRSYTLLKSLAWISLTSA